MHDTHVAPFSDKFEFSSVKWGEVIRGTKLDLQRLGLGVDKPFPEEPGGPRNSLSVMDRRGLRAKIVRCLDDVFQASISFPGFGWRDVIGDHYPWIMLSPGLKKREWRHYDEFQGTPTALDHAGLVRPDQLPGQPGMRRTSVVILPDGTAALDRPQFRVSPPGARIIKPASKSTYIVEVRLSDEAAERRRTAMGLADSEQSLRYDAVIAAMERPAPLWPLPIALARQAGGSPPRARPSYLRLVVANESAPLRSVKSGPRPTLLEVHSGQPV